MPHDIIDNRKERLLVDQIKTILGSTEAARFAVGYFFLSGFTPLADQLQHVKELKLLIGNTTNKETLEQIAEGYKRLELVAEAAESQAYPKRADVKRMAADTATGIRSSVEVMDQTDDSEEVIRTLARMIEEKRLLVRVYTKGRLHAKAYIFDYGQSYDLFGHIQPKIEKGVAIVGSSNLTLSGISHNTELNVMVHGNGNHEELVHWFDELWNEAEPFDEELMQEIQQSWAMAPVRPYDVYMKTLYTLVRDRIEGDDDKDILWDDEIANRLATFQRVAVKQAIQLIRVNGGAFVSDVVGLGKSYIGAAIIKHFERTDHARPLIVCPAPLVEMWERYNEVYQLNARVLSTGFLQQGDGNNMLLDDMRFRDRDFLLIDESHNFRYPDTQRYKCVEAFLASGRPVCFLTATPRNKSAWDVYHQIKLFHQQDKTDLPIDPPNLREYFKLIEKGERKLRELLSNVLIRRTRSHILRFYGFDAETNEKVDPTKFAEYSEGKRKAYVIVAGKHQFFPKRELDTVEYSIEETYQGLYQTLRAYIGKKGDGKPAATAKLSDQLTYARYGLWHYVKKEKQKREPYVSLQRAGSNLRGLMRILMFKRFESSVYAFQQTIGRMISMHEHFLDALREGVVPAGEEAQAILYEPSAAEEQDLVDALRKVSGRYALADFDSDTLVKHIEHDLKLLRKIKQLVAPITPDKDAKLTKLKEVLNKMPLKEGKRLLFTQYADTAVYLYDNLNPGDTHADIQVIYSSDKSKARTVGRFAPKANPEYKFQAGEAELRTLVATDVLAEGLNLQDCNKIINYDLHWNPVRLIQRFGRIDRIGSEHEVVHGFNFLPEVGIESNLGLRQCLRNRIQEIHDTIGEDSAILDRTEQLNEEAMYAIYDKKSLGSEALEGEEGEFLDLNEAEEILRQLKADDPAEYERIANLRDGIRTAKSSDQKGTFAFFQAGRYQQLVMLNEKGEVVSKDVPKVLGAIKCGVDLQGQPLPTGYNAAIMHMKRSFDEEVKQRESERQHTLSLTLGQRYVMRELSVLFRASQDEDQKGQVTLLEKAFRSPLTKALQRELTLLRRNGVTGEGLVRSLAKLYLQHNLRDWLDRRNGQPEEDSYPRIICSEGLV
jgi:superfamily II DNA or RNA helicase